MGGGSSNSEIINYQKEEAKKAELKEQERQNRLQSGRDRLMAMFSETGGEYTDPAEYKDVTTQVSQPVYASVNPSYNLGTRYTGSPVQQQQPQTQIGTKMVNKTTKQWVPGQTHKVAGIGQNFYDSFKNSILDYYNPEIERQFGEAQEQNLFDLARRGTLRSSQAAKNAAEIARERADADARVAADAERQTAGLRGDIANAQQSALSLLQQTEDPTAAANAAATEVNAIQSQAPQFNPLGELFSAAARSFAGYQQQQRDKRLYQQLAQGSNPWASSGRTVV